MIWTLAFWKGLAERAVKTLFQSGIAATASLGVVSGSSSLADVPWTQVLSITAVATILSIATSIGNASFTAGTTATDLDASSAGAESTGEYVAPEGVALTPADTTETTDSTTGA